MFASPSRLFLTLAAVAALCDVATSQTPQSGPTTGDTTAASVTEPLSAAPGTKSDIVITSPTSGTEWHTQSENSIEWTGTTPSVFSFQIINSDRSVLADGLSLGNNIPVTARKDTFQLGDVKPASGYKVRIYDVRNISVELATSPSFSILAKIQTPATNSSNATSSWNGLGNGPNAASAGSTTTTSQTASNVTSNGGISPTTTTETVHGNTTVPSSSTNTSTRPAPSNSTSAPKNVAMTSFETHSSLNLLFFNALLAGAIMALV
ncbi:hypothetical protein FA10DRAFT_286029 [Acaromyces ingoldii]|uniref:Ser-Thr-rich glycosyl-phosphatidyl-inositol-anchored membrane family-domain-containing protein n=1 Tax=Acaromyces ingoldii TaxID=215250 RepID=A0A316YM39_9BASI|nr:hypothetical protein FA10DRAFT_286029 [Acaromyces ingoldii]PWN90319.1 hypothetical protein FA10DRAFT_286029 [Acaromyces ingoldii]